MAAKIPFDEALRQSGISLSPDERASVESLAGWLDDGLARLATLEAEPPQAAEDLPDASFALDLSILEQGRMLREGRLTSVALTRATLARIAERNPVLGAFVTITVNRALDDARRADDELLAGTDRGPLHGIPVAVKDLIDVAGIPTTAGSKSRADAVATGNAEAVQRLVVGGAVIVGKLATYEWGTVGPAFDTLFPPARNPWSLEHITGGSSSGCASAVAGGLIHTSIGTDTGGSLRSPASYCGVVGLKPTFGLVPKSGAIAVAPSMDHVGPISATVAEAAITLDVLTGRAGTPDAASAGLGQGVSGLRLGYARSWFADDPQALPEIVAAIDDAVSHFSLMGALVEQVKLPDYALFEAAGAAILHAEAFALHGKALAETPEAYGRKSFQTLASGLALTEADLAQARRAGKILRDQVDAVFARCDVIVTASTLTAALPVAAFGQSAVWTPMRTIGFNVTGHPVLALPIGLHAGLPIGLQLIAPHHAEAELCRAGAAYEQRTPTPIPVAPWPPKDQSAQPG